MESKKAIAYLRVSSAGQGEEGKDGFPRQRAAIEKWAAANDVKVARWVEEDISGDIPPAQRPKFADLTTRLLANGVRTLLVENYGRLARASMYQELTVAYFEERGLEIIAVEVADLAHTENDPFKTAMRQMMGTFHQLEKNAMVKKLKDARLRARKKNPNTYREGRKPFGHFAGEPDTLLKMKKLRSEGLSFQRIADRLNHAGLKPRAAEIWHPSSVQAILRANAST
jgi:DNA invertase Pin-like site-specific DNA recombinase